MVQTAKTIHQRLKSTLTGLPIDKLEQVADYAEYLRSREEWEATMEILNDPGMKRDVDEGRKQVIEGKTRSWKEIKKSV